MLKHVHLAKPVSFLGKNIYNQNSLLSRHLIFLMDDPRHIHTQ
jgi:hypothetical protein